MASGSVETTLELWASASRDVKGRMRPLFSQNRVAASGWASTHRVDIHGRSPKFLCIDCQEKPDAPLREKFYCGSDCSPSIANVIVVMAWVVPGCPPPTLSLYFPG